MISFATAIGLFALAAGFSLVLTRTARNLAIRVGMIDRPDGHRKIQTVAVPVAGGAAVLAASLLAVFVAGLADPDVVALIDAEWRQALALFAAAVVITAVGVVDDRYNLRARHKLLGQGAAVFILVVGGDLVVHRVGLFGWTVPLGPLAGPVTAVWLLACVNALNLIDGMDGLLGTVGGIAPILFT